MSKHIPKSSDEYIAAQHELRPFDEDNVDYITSLNIPRNGLFVFGYNYAIGPANAFRYYMLSQMEKDDNDIRYTLGEYGCKFSDYMIKVYNLNHTEVGLVVKAVNSNNIVTLGALLSYTAKQHNNKIMEKITKVMLEH